MREFVLAAAIVVASFAQAKAMPVDIPTSYPAPGVFCGFMQLCTAEVAAPNENPKPLPQQPTQHKTAKQ